MNRSSAQGRALYSTCHKSHLEIALDLVNITYDLFTICYM